MKGIYHIWLADEPTFMDFRPEDMTLPRTKKASIEADSVSDAFWRSQNGVHGEWEKFEQRSCSVGDVIESPDGKFHFVAFVGFRDIEKP